MNLRAPLFCLALIASLVPNLRADIAPSSPLRQYPGELIVRNVSKIPGLALIACVGTEYQVVKEGVPIKIPTGQWAWIMGIRQDTLAKIQLKDLAPVRSNSFYYQGRRTEFFIPGVCLESNACIYTARYTSSPVSSVSCEFELQGIEEQQNYLADYHGVIMETEDRADKTGDWVAKPWLSLDISVSDEAWKQAITDITQTRQKYLEAKEAAKGRLLDPNRFQLNPTTQKWESKRITEKAKRYDPETKRWEPYHLGHYRLDESSGYWTPLSMKEHPQRMDSRTGAWESRASYYHPQVVFKFLKKTTRIEGSPDQVEVPEARSTKGTPLSLDECVIGTTLSEDKRPLSFY